jgi:hypothetical protein
MSNELLSRTNANHVTGEKVNWTCHFSSITLISHRKKQMHCWQQPFPKPTLEPLVQVPG